MTIGEIYSVLSLIFASNFKQSINKEDFSKLSPNWLLQNETLENKKGRELWQSCIKNSDITKINRDFFELNKFFDLTYFMLLYRSDMDEFFLKHRYQTAFDELSSTHISNLLLFLSSAIKLDRDEKSHNLLINFTNDKLLPSAKALGFEIKTNAQSDYYKAIGWLFLDFCNMLEISLGR